MPDEQPLARDMDTVQSTDDVVELRKQQTRRIVTYALVGTYCAITAYLIFAGAEQMQASALSGLLGVVASVIGFYFGAKQSRE